MRRRASNHSTSHHSWSVRGSLSNANGISNDFEGKVTLRGFVAERTNKRSARDSAKSYSGQRPGTGQSPIKAFFDAKGTRGMELQARQRQQHHDRYDGNRNAPRPQVSSPGELREMVREAASILNSQQEYLVTLPPENGKAKMVNAMNSLDQHLEALKSKLDGGSESGATVEEIYHLQQNALHSVSQMKTASVQKFPFEIPKEYASHERLLGRATAEVRVRTTPPGERPKTVTMELTIDGYNAPITAGRFVSLAKKGFYDDMEIQRSDGFIVQTGDAKKKVAEQIPLEIKVETQKLPIYEYTLESVSRFDEPVTLPFNALGTLAMSRNIDDPNSADTQIFWLLKDNDMTPSGTNVLDGRFAVFGYTTKNNDALRELRVGDKIESVRITSGLEHFKGVDV
eukprot:jgi/Bigna1/92923/estExt_fgenesh1_pm.C_990010